MQAPRKEPIRSISSFIPCEAIRERLHIYLEGGTPEGGEGSTAAPLTAPYTREQVASHLAGCAACGESLRLLEEERRFFLESVMTTPTLSSHFAERVVEEIRRSDAQDSERRAGTRLGRLALLSTAAAAAAVVFAVGGFNPKPEEPRSPGIASDSATVVSPTPASAPPAFDSSPHLVSLPARRPPKLSVSIEYSASIFRPGKALPCSGDVNHDGETNASDAAHLFMLTVAPSPAPSPGGLTRYVSAEDLEPDCNSPCQI